MSGTSEVLEKAAELVERDGLCSLQLLMDQARDELIPKSERVGQMGPGVAARACREVWLFYGLGTWTERAGWYDSFIGRPQDFADALRQAAAARGGERDGR